MSNLEIQETENKGRGVFAKKDFRKGEVIEVCPVIRLSEKDREVINETELYNYYFSWKEEKAAIALGYGSLYNHSFEPNADYEKDLENSQIIFRSLRSIEKGEEILVDYTQGGNKEDLWFELK
ncbi:MAG: SET domain-containing protein [Candidatus Magasanikbacteria bacterium]